MNMSPSIGIITINAEKGVYCRIVLEALAGIMIPFTTTTILTLYPLFPASSSQNRLPHEEQGVVSADFLFPLPLREADLSLELLDVDGKLDRTDLAVDFLALRIGLLPTLASAKERSSLPVPGLLDLCCFTKSQCSALVSLIEGSLFLRRLLSCGRFLAGIETSDAKVTSWSCRSSQSAKLGLSLLQSALRSTMPPALRLVTGELFPDALSMPSLSLAL
jgi:hypothetical protein